MAIILNFPSQIIEGQDLKTEAAKTALRKEGEVIIFSGVRIERLENQPVKTCKQQSFNQKLK